MSRRSPGSPTPRRSPRSPAGRSSSCRRWSGTPSRRSSSTRSAAKAVAGLTDVVQSVLTGSSRPNAMLKLRAFGLDRYLDLAIGGFAGSEVYPKGALLRAARLRAEEKYLASFAERATVYIADSPRDVEAARTGGATSTAVASGRAASAELRDAGADAVLRDLTDPEALVALITTAGS